MPAEVGGPEEEEKKRRTFRVPKESPTSGEKRKENSTSGTLRCPGATGWREKKWFPRKKEGYFLASGRDKHASELVKRARKKKGKKRRIPSPSRRRGRKASLTP